MSTITVRGLAALSKTPGRRLFKKVSHGHGGLVFRSLADGEISIYFRYYDEGKQKTLLLGRYDEKGVKGLTLKQATEHAGRLSSQHASGGTAIREHVEAQKSANNQHLRKATTGTFEQLLDNYVDYLKAEGKPSEQDVRSLFKCWIREPHPALLTRKASDITHQDIMTILIFAVKKGVKRTVNKLRTSLYSAFNRAMGTIGDPSVAAQVGVGYNITINPVASTQRVAKFENVRDRHLSEAELRGFLLAVDKLPVMQMCALRLVVGLGGQRPHQLLRLKPADVSLEDNTLRLFDPKGRRSQARTHTLPIPPAVLGCVKTLLQHNSEAPYLFSSDGERAMAPTTISKVVRRIGKGKYQMRDIRRTCETMLAALGISKDLRAQIQSHGLGGIQDRHYDRHKYMDEKRNALEAWNTKLEEIKTGQRAAGKVVSLRG